MWMFSAANKRPIGCEGHMKGGFLAHAPKRPNLEANLERQRHLCNPSPPGIPQAQLGRALS